MSRRTVRLVVVPALLLAAVSSVTYALAREPLAKPDVSSAGADASGDPARGAQLFADRCAGCHGDSGRNGPSAPDLAGSTISIEDAKAQIETGGGIMPPDLVTGQDLQDVLAYLETLFR